MKLVSINAAARIEACPGAPGKSPTFAMIPAYSGGPLELDNYDLPVYVDLSSLQTSPQIVANYRHNQEDTVGHVESVTNDGATLAMNGALSYPSESRDVILSAASSGFPMRASIEVSPGKINKVEAGRTAQVNGRTISGPAYIATDGRLYGVAFVPRGADESTSVSIAAAAARKGAKAMTFEEWCKSIGVDVASATPEQVSGLKAAFSALQGAPPDTMKAGAMEDKPAEQMPVAAGARHWDAGDIMAAHADALDSIDAEIMAIEDDAPADIVAKAKKEARDKLKSIKASAARGRWSVDKYNAEAVKAVADAKLAVVRGVRPTAPAIHAKSRDLSAKMIEAAACQHLKLPNIEKHFKEDVLESAHAEFRGRLGLQQLLAIQASGNGWLCRPGERIHAGNLREVLAHAFHSDIRASGAFSLSSVSGILSNIANKEILEGWMQEDQAWREIAAVKTVNDFKTVTGYKLLDDLEYELLPKGGQIAHGSVGEGTYTRQARTYAKMHSITREDIINDDLGAFDTMRDRIGAGASKKLSTVFWTRFLDNSAHFTTALTNYIEGATTNLGADGVGLSAGVKAFRQMRTSSADGSKRVGGSPPTLLLVPPELEAIAEALYVARNVAQVKASDANIHAGKYRPIVSPWLSDSSFTGYSTTAWYLFRAPTSSVAPVAVSFLDGVETPTVESSDADFNQLGIQIRGYHDFGVDLFEPLAGIKSKGAA